MANADSESDEGVGVLDYRTTIPERITDRMRRNVKIALVGVVLGIVILVVGLLGGNLWPSSVCPSSKFESIPPTTCQPFPYWAIVAVGLAIIVASLVAMAYSFLNRTTPSGTGRFATP